MIMIRLQRLDSVSVRTHIAYVPTVLLLSFDSDRYSGCTQC